MVSPPRRLWFDAHLDLAYLTEIGRDMHTGPQRARGRLSPAAVTLPSLREGGVDACLGTIFTEALPDPKAPGAENGAFAYPAGDAEAAHAAGLRQLKLYQAWASDGVIRLMGRRGAGPVEGAAFQERRILVGILMECADPIREPAELEWWAEQGVIAIGLTWSVGSRYAGGNAHGAGLAPRGRELIASMDSLGIVQDVSHLSQAALDEVLEATDATLIATHSNCRALMGGDGAKSWQRHLSDETIREIARRGGVIGINLFSGFLTQSPGKPGRATIDHVCAHVERICEIAGDRTHVGLGSDMDGGFGADKLPNGIDTPVDLEKLASALRDRGWSDEEVTAFAWQNWARFWEGAESGRSPTN